MTHDEIKPQDHPDFVGGWVWTSLETRWIEERIAEAIRTERQACAELCIELAPSIKTSTGYKVLHEASRAIQARGKA